MKKLQMLTAAGSILLALAGPTLAAQRAHRGADAFASGAVTSDRSGSYYYGPQDAQGRATSAPVHFDAPAVQARPSGNLPYPDRPWGDPDRW
jgi:hypothetical protein